MSGVMRKTLRAAGKLNNPLPFVRWCASEVVNTKWDEGGGPPPAMSAIPPKSSILLLLVLTSDVFSVLRNTGYLKYLQVESTRKELVCCAQAFMKSFTMNAKAWE